jgi:hypothetical protein
MADQFPITSFETHKADLPNYPTPIASAFCTLLPALAQHIEAEREIEHVDIWNTAFRSWLTDAEHAFTEVTTQLSVIMATDLACIEDKPLKRMVMLIDALVGSEEPDTFQHLYGLLPKFQHLFYCSGKGPAVRHRNLMLKVALEHIDTMATLLTYDSAANGGSDEMVNAPLP